MNHRYRVGDKVVYTRDKYTSKPGPRAKNVFATPNGESYQYQVEKYWIVVGVQSGDLITLQTRRGKQHAITQDDPRLRKATFFEKLFKARLFPNPASPTNFVQA